MGGLAPAVSAALGVPITLGPTLGGGSIASVRLATTADGTRLVVKHQPQAPAGLFAAEVHGLAWLREVDDGPRVPAVLAHSDGELAFMVLEFIPPGTVRDDQAFGRALAALHRSGAPTFGLERDNLLATIAQDNRPCDDWPTFLASRRLVPLRDLAVARGALPAGVVADLDRVIDRVGDLTGPPEPPARLHGDLWAGNVLTAPDGRAVVIDPAVFGGHREVDLAMMRLFGGFGPDVFAAYDEAYPLADGHVERGALNQLIPLLVHVILFGAGYVHQLAGAVRQVLSIR